MRTPVCLYPIAPCDGVERWFIQSVFGAVDGAQLRSVPSGGGSLHGQCVPRQEPGDEGARVLHLPRFGLAT